MAEFMAKLPRFSVNVRIGYDVVQESGQKIEFGETRKITINRPDRLRIEVERSDGDQGLVVFDGKDIIVYDAAEKVFGKVVKPGSLDQAIVYFVKDLQMRLPLAQLFVTSLPAQLAKRVKTVNYVERTAIVRVVCDHLAARAETVDFQIWIAQGEQPLLQRIVITYRQAEGQPQFWAQFSDWNLTPDVSEPLFSFTPPADAEQIPFLVAVHNVGDDAEPVEKQGDRQ
jgi:hypothetical protein